MAGSNIPPIMTVAGVAHRVEKRTLKATETLPARTVADVVVLTDGGGFASVYLADEKMADCPVQGERVNWLCEVGIWNRRRRDGEGTYPTLHVKLTEALPVESLTAGAVVGYELANAS